MQPRLPPFTCDGCLTAPEAEIAEIHKAIARDRESQRKHQEAERHAQQLRERYYGGRVKILLARAIGVRRWNGETECHILQICENVIDGEGLVFLRNGNGGMVIAQSGGVLTEAVTNNFNMRVADWRLLLGDQRQVVDVTDWMPYELMKQELARWIVDNSQTAKW
jgi:hypothetical protein